MRPLKEYIGSPYAIVLGLGRRQLLNWMSDEQYLKLVYKMIFNKKLNLENPQTYSEKLQWMKIHDRNPLYTTLVDKKEVKDAITVEELIVQEDVETPQYVTVSVNDDFIDKAEFETYALKEGDSVEFLYFMGGGR